MSNLSAPTSIDAVEVHRRSVLCQRCAALRLDDKIGGILDGSKHDSFSCHHSSPACLEVDHIELKDEHADAKCDLCRLFYRSALSSEKFLPGIYSLLFMTEHWCQPWWNRTFIMNVKSKYPGLNYATEPRCISVIKADKTVNAFGRVIKPQADLALLRKWMARCETDHKICQLNSSQRDSSFEISLIDCHSRMIILGSLRSKYAALSYVWGTDSAYPAGTYIALPPVLPALVEDAITVVKEIGLKYLWIDRYCISSDDKDLQYNQIQHMDEIYSGAEITIVSLGEGSLTGLPGVGNTPRGRQETAILGQYQLAKSFDRPKKAVDSAPWSSRAWTFQEGILSKRVVCFTKDQMYFECRSSARCETLVHYEESEQPPWAEAPGPFPGFYSEPVILRTDSQMTWSWLQSLIMGYSAKSMTFQSDALNAFLGILHRFQQSPSYIGHLWGITFPMGRKTCPIDTRTSFIFVAQLHWFEKSDCLSRRSEFPSWSWLGWRFDLSNFLLSVDVGDIESWPIYDTTVLIESPNGSWSSIEDFLKSGGLDIPPSKLSHHIRIHAWVVPVKFVASDELMVTHGSRSNEREASEEHEPQFFASFKTKDGKTIRSEGGYELPHDVGLDGSSQWFAVLLWPPEHVSLPARLTKMRVFWDRFLLVSGHSLDEEEIEETQDHTDMSGVLSGSSIDSAGVRTVSVVGERMASVSFNRTCNDHLWNQGPIPVLTANNFLELPWTRSWVDLK